MDIFKRGNENFMFDEKSKKFNLQNYKDWNFEISHENFHFPKDPITQDTLKYPIA